MIVECRDGTARDFSLIIADNARPEDPSLGTFKCHGCGGKVHGNNPKDMFDKLFGHVCDDA